MLSLKILTFVELPFTTLTSKLNSTVGLPSGQYIVHILSGGQGGQPCTKTSLADRTSNWAYTPASTGAAIVGCKGNAKASATINAINFMVKFFISVISLFKSAFLDSKNYPSNALLKILCPAFGDSSKEIG